MTSNDICTKAEELASAKTMYVKRGKGERLTLGVRSRFASIDEFNAKRSAAIMAADDNTRAFDEFGLVTAVVGRKCKSFSDAMDICESVSKDFSTILPGEIVFLKDRIGFFIGDNKVVTVDILGVGITIADGWASHGKINGVEYAEPVVEEPVTVTEEVTENEPKESRMEVRRDRIRNRH